jgi:hypothetical protein
MIKSKFKFKAPEQQLAVKLIGPNYYFWQFNLPFQKLCQ